MVIFHSYVSLPEGIFPNIILRWDRFQSFSYPFGLTGAPFRRICTHFSRDGARCRDLSYESSKRRVVAIDWVYHIDNISQEGNQSMTIVAMILINLYRGFRTLEESIHVLMHISTVRSGNDSYRPGFLGLPMVSYDHLVLFCAFQTTFQFVYSSLHFSTFWFAMELCIYIYILKKRL